LSQSNGDGGYHLRIIFDRPAPTAKVFYFLQWIIRDYDVLGLARRPETFPKQPFIGPNGYGNWLRVPGRHHTREHWTRFWSSAEWIGGGDAVAYILAHRPDNADLIPDRTPVPQAPIVRNVSTSPAVYNAGEWISKVQIVRRCLDATTSHADDYHDWLKVGLICHDTSEELFADWEAWSRHSAKYVAGECQAKWRTFSPPQSGRIATIGTLVAWARQAGVNVYPTRTHCGNSHWEGAAA
jgi:hypothetical protein